jgi:hypothetical protein
MPNVEPIFYDCEASAYEGFPIEVGWAFYDHDSGIVSEGHLIRPPAEWRIEKVWDPGAEKRHGITPARLGTEGELPWDVARRMNIILAGRELYSDAAPYDQYWLRLLFDAGGVDPVFTTREMDARVLISARAAKRGMDASAFAQAKARAMKYAPRRHRAEADARFLAALWIIVSGGTLAP